VDKKRKVRHRILISSHTEGGYVLIDLDELRMRWNPEKKMRKKVTSKLMKTGCAAYVPALLHTEHVHPLLMGVYASGVYKANRNALFCCK